ncbi:11396_t:CDS:2 [Ambispora gerdemannii]|uniref:11396_t:CDS:1 n=1 Tax=Ambispora gerdemannii TaxID=144530 RepID=A0A9N8YP63_9GLOM|nr:11396_t:CDS:2 [Ambispora gerdemannii]
MSKRIGTLTRTAQILLDLRTGLGAAKLSPRVRKISLSFSRKEFNAGARYFLRENLPRIAYNNPTIPIEVEISKEKGIMQSLIVELDDPKDTLAFDCQRQSSDICRDLLNATQAVPAILLLNEQSKKDLFLDKDDTPKVDIKKWVY